MVYRPCFYKADILIPITGLIVLLEAINILFKNILWPLALFVFWTLKKMKNWIQERLIGLVLDSMIC